jgi:hypothetical protein
MVVAGSVPPLVIKSIEVVLKPLSLDVETSKPAGGVTVTFPVRFVPETV